MRSRHRAATLDHEYKARIWADAALARCEVVLRSNASYRGAAHGNGRAGEERRESTRLEISNFLGDSRAAEI
jgi:hypothetical protein